MQDRRNDAREEEAPTSGPAVYEPPELVRLGAVHEHTLAKRGALTDGIHVQRSGGSVFVAHTSA